MYWRAWHALRADRQYGDYGGMSPIWFSAIKAYADQYGITDDDFDTFHTIIMSMDAEYVEIEKARQKEEAERNKSAE